MRKLREILQHFLRRLRQTPLLLGWLLLGPLVALLTEGWLALAFGLVNVLLLGVYAVLLHWMTPDPPGPLPVKRPRLELAMALALFIMFLITQMLAFDVWTAQPWHGWVHSLSVFTYQTAYSAPGLPNWARQDVYLALSSTLKQLLPTLLLFWGLGYRRTAMGLRHPHWRLTTVLVSSTAAFGLLTGVLLRAPLGQALGLYAIGILVNALPEELFFRGLLLPRLEKALGNPLNALVVSALLFNALHIPIEIYNGASPLAALLGVFSIGYPSGLLWGYLYLRTRSILPGTFWHAANGNLGFLMMSV